MQTAARTTVQASAVLHRQNNRYRIDLLTRWRILSKTFSAHRSLHCQCHDLRRRMLGKSQRGEQWVAHVLFFCNRSRAGLRSSKAFLGSRSALGSRCTSLARGRSYTLQQRRNICLAQLGIFFSTSTGHTEDIASIIKEVIMQPSFTAERRMICTHVLALRVGARWRRCRSCRHWRDGAGEASRLRRPCCGCTYLEHRLRHRTERNQLGRYS